MKRNEFQQDYSPASVSEQDFFECICDDELLVLLMYFQQERREAFKVYVQFLEFVHEATSLAAIDRLNDEKAKFWQKQLHYENLAGWCFAELNKRRKDE